MEKIVFHHCTTETSAKAIKECRQIHKTVKQPGGGDACFGDGTYGTPLGPENGRKALAQNNYGDAWKYFEDIGRVNVVIRIVLDGSKVDNQEYNGRQIYIHDGDILLDDAEEVDFIYFEGDGKYRVEKFK